MIKAPFINLSHYDFIDKNTGKRVKGNTMRCLVDNEIVKVTLDDETAKSVINQCIKFGDMVDLNVKIKGKYAKYVLEKYVLTK